MKFVKYDDVKHMVESANDLADLIEKFEKLQVVDAERRPYVPLKIRNYGFKKPTERYVGEDFNHDWLEITNDGSLRYVNMQNGGMGCNEADAKEAGEYCFIPTYVSNIDDEKYITAESMCYMIDEDDIRAGDNDE